jgi:hypothetical protein
MRTGDRTDSVKTAEGFAIRCRSWAASAVAAEGSEHAAAWGGGIPLMSKRIGCYFGFHRWQTLQAEGGGTYKKCRDCGKFSDVPSRPYLPGGN